MNDQERYETLTKIIEISSSAARINERLLQIGHFLCLRGIAPTIAFYLLQHRGRCLTLRLATDSGGKLQLPAPPCNYVQPDHDDPLCRPVSTRITTSLDPEITNPEDLFRRERPHGLSLPLADEAHVYGVMAIFCRKPFSLDEQTIQFLLVVCRQIASCLREDILKKRARKKVSRLKFLHRIGARLNASEDLQSVFSQLPDESPVFFAHSASVLNIFTAENTPPQTIDQGFSNQPQRALGLKISRLQATQTKFAPHPTVFDQYSLPSPLYQHFFEHFSAHITLPLISRGVRLGTLEFFLDRDPKTQYLLPLEKPDLELLEILAVHMAATLERSRTQSQLNAANQASLMRTRQLTISHRMKNALLAADSSEKIIRLTLGALVSDEGFSCSPALYFDYQEKKDFRHALFYAQTPQNSAIDNPGRSLADEATPLKTLTEHLLQASDETPEKVETEMARLKFANFENAPGRLNRALNEKKPAIIPARFVTALHPALANVIPGSAIIVIPIPGKEYLKGIILANADRIKQTDLSYITLFTDAATLALDNTELYQLLQNSLATLNSAQNRLTQNEKLIALGEMATSIAHEIKNPLLSIGGFARRLHKKIPDDTREKSYSLVITKEIERLEEIVNNVLSFSRPASNIFSPHDINQLIKESTDLFARELKKLEIELSLQLTPEMPPVECDGNQIKQVMINLINNSIHAITDSEAELQAHQITIRSTPFCNLEQHDERVQIEIEDSGSGIQEQVIHDIFNPFFTTKHDGTGLGLPICHRIILNHQGEIRINNQVGRGVKVTITLPFEHKGITNN